jgi:hypothetical protein
MPRSINKSSILNSLLGFLVLASGQQVANAALSAEVPVQILAKRAEFVVTGLVTQGQYSHGSASLTIKIERVLKGDAGTGQSVSVSWRPASTIVRPDHTLDGVRGLFFCNRGDAGSWVLVPVTDGAIHDVMQTFFLLPADAGSISYAADDSLVDKIVRELIPTHVWRSKQGITASASVVDTVLGGSDGSRALKEVSAQLLLHGAREDRILALHALVLLGDASALSVIDLEQDNLIGESDRANMLGTPQVAVLTDAIKTFYKTPDAAGVSVLVRWVDSTPYQTLREAAAAALARIHTQETLPSLAKLLNSPDLRLRVYAVGGLAMFANNVPIGSHEPGPQPWKYRTDETMLHSAMGAKAIAANESFYVDFWKQWWKDNSASLVH